MIVNFVRMTNPQPSVHSNSIHGSAVCAYNMSAIHAAFAGPFKHQEHPDTTWKRQDTPHRDHYECKTGRGSVVQLLDSARYQLMDQAVQPSNGRPLHHAQLERYTHIALDQISTKLHEQVRILYVATTGGLVKKISVLPRTKETCVIEMWQPQPDGSQPILALEFLKETQSLYVGTEAALMRIGAHHCGRHGQRASCLNAMDPYCGWNELQEACTPPPNGDTLSRYWIQNATACPVLTAPVDGGWSAWSDWFRCSQSGQSSSSAAAAALSSGIGSIGIGNSFGGDAGELSPDSCQCRTRACDNPAARNGGDGCSGMSIMVTNCTVNGGWTDWSAWSACSQTCGVAVKTRRRTCGNPKPAHGGRVCVGSDRSELYCSHLPPCPVPKQPAQDGGWSQWGGWGECSAPCGGGYRMRKRRCDDPAPMNGGMECGGCHIDWEMCNAHACPELKRSGSWTPWMVQVNGSMGDGGQLERRFRFACRATVTDVGMMKVTLDKEQTRVCQADGSCQKSGEGGAEDSSGWGEWGVWSACSAECDGGQQFRQRSCEKGGCEGTGKMARACNTHSCKGEFVIGKLRA